MKKILTTVVIGLISASALFAQNTMRSWSDGRLTWSDFMERTGDLTHASEFRYVFSFASDRQRFGDTTVLRIVANAYMDRSLSWINSDRKTEQVLIYNQVLFEIVELHRRRLQMELDRLRHMFDVHAIFQSRNNLLIREINTFQEETNWGANLNALTAWQWRIAYELTGYAESGMPELDFRSEWGMHLGFGSSGFTGAIGDHFNPTFNFAFGFDFSFRKHTLFLNGNLGWGSVRQDYFLEHNWYSGQRINLAVLNIAYGYVLHDDGRFRVTPFVGFGVTELSKQQERNNTDDIPRLANGNVVFGVSADYRFRRKMVRLFPNSNPFSLGVREQMSASIRARLYVTRANFAPDMSGYAINFTVGVSGISNIIRVR